MSWHKPGPLSLHLRLLLSLGVGLVALMVVLFVLLDRSIDQRTYGYLDSALRARAHAIAVLLESHPRAVALAQVQAMSPTYGNGQHSDFVQLWDADGHTLLASESDGANRLDVPPDVPANGVVFYNLRLPDRYRGRAVAQRVTLRGRAVDATLVVAEEREQFYALEHGLHITLATVIAIIALCAILLALFSVRTGLRPLLALGASVRQHPERLALPTARLPRELRPLVDTLNAAFARLTQALVRERRFAHDVAHELRTPLAGMRTALELARRDAPGSPALDGALASAERMARSIDGLLALSRYESGLQEVETEPLDLVDLLRRARDLVAPLAARRNVAFDSSMPAECWITGDPTLLERIVDNLLLNAAAYAPAHSVVSLRLADAGGQIALTIANRAPELAPEDLDRLGERFWRKSAARESSQHGGLGLALAHGLADLLGLRLAFRLDAGTLTVELAGLPRLELPS